MRDSREYERFYGDELSPRSFITQSREYLRFFSSNRRSVTWPVVRELLAWIRVRASSYQ